MQTASPRILPGILLGLLLVSISAAGSAQVEMWLTNPDKSALFQRQSVLLTFAEAASKHPTIEVDDTKTYQTMDGFGFALTGGSAQLIRPMRRMRACLRSRAVSQPSANLSLYRAISSAGACNGKCGECGPSRGRKDRSSGRGHALAENARRNP